MADRQLTKLLTELGQEVVIQPDGRSATRDELLAAALWDLALGGVFETPEGTPRFFRPDKQIAMFILERREGRMPVNSSTDGDKDKLTAAEKIDDLAKERINAEADAVEADSLDPLPGDSSDLDVPHYGPPGAQETDTES